MTTVILRHPPDADTDCVQIDIHVDAKILTAKIARRKANVWLLMNIGHLIRADNPELILLDDQLIWRYDIILNPPGKGRLGVVGRIAVDAISGEVLVVDEQTLYQEVLDRADALIGP